MLHFGASLHGHEYSPTTNTPARRSPLIRSALSAYDSPKISTRPVRHSSLRSSQDHARVSFQQPDIDTMSDGGRSNANSDASETTVGGTKSKRRSIRSTTSYHFAHPAPTLTQKQKLLHIRPKLLLQLQRLPPHSRPIPAIDVLPSSVIVPRLAKRFPRMFKGKAELGTNDVMVVKSEDYNGPDNDSDADLGEEDSVAEREVLAVICQIKGLPGQAEICFSNGSKWYAIQSPKGSKDMFEFVTTDPVTGEKTTARWVSRAKVRREPDPYVQVLPGPSCSSEAKFQFSILDPNSRRHPILAWMSQGSLDIPDSYTTVSSSAGRYPPTSPLRTPTTGSQFHFDVEEKHERSTYALDERLKTLIQITGIWVALRQGWCQYFHYDDHPSPGIGAKSGMASSSHPAGRPRSASLTQEHPNRGLADSGASTPESTQGSFGTMSGKILRTGHIFRYNPTVPLATQFDPAAPLPKRSVSTGTAFMQRAAIRRSAAPSNPASDSEGESYISSPKPIAAPQSPLLPFESSIPDTPTRPFHRRVQSAMISVPVERPLDGTTANNLNGLPYKSNHNPPIMDEHQHVAPRARGPRWKSLINFFRRSGRQ